jgi:cytochrome c oxidase assembly protein subunit 11
VPLISPLFQVFFYIDPEFLEDPAMDGVNNIVLSYTFFKCGEDDDLATMQE